MLRSGGIFDPEKIKENILELEAKSVEPNFWNDQESARKTLAELESLKGPLEKVQRLEKELQNVADYLELSKTENDPELEKEIDSCIEKAEKEIAEFGLLLKLSEKHDKDNAILTINAGAGGTDAQDWAQMLLRMYLRFCEKNNFETKLVDLSEGEEAGIKSATVIVNGLYAYGYLKAEKGVHRLVRISPFNANGKRQTSFASVEVIPEIIPESEVAIKADDLKIDTFRASGAGGQHINKTDSAVRIKHLPTGLVVTCQNGRSQIQNRETAMQVLYSRLKKLQEEQHKETIDELKGEQKEIGWGSQIRSYVFHPYSLVKDHRFNKEMTDVQKVMDGDIMEFIEAYLKNNK